MEPAPRKRFMECPDCRSPAVHVPWEPQSVTGRRRMLWGLAFFWLTSLALVAPAILTGEFLWLVGLAAYGLVTIAVAVAYYRSAHSYRCASCNRRWRD